MNPYEPNSLPAMICFVHRSLFTMGFVYRLSFATGFVYRFFCYTVHKSLCGLQDIHKQLCGWDSCVWHPQPCFVQIDEPFVCFLRLLQLKKSSVSSVVKSGGCL